jgi:hypothetical protein
MVVVLDNPVNGFRAGFDQGHGLRLGRIPLDLPEGAQDFPLLQFVPLGTGDDPGIGLVPADGHLIVHRVGLVTRLGVSYQGAAQARESLPKVFR